MILAELRSLRMHTTYAILPFSNPRDQLPSLRHLSLQGYKPDRSFGQRQHQMVEPRYDLLESHRLPCLVSLSLTNPPFTQENFLSTFTLFAPQIRFLHLQMEGIERFSGLLASCKNLSHLCLITPTFSSLVSILESIPTQLVTFVTSRHVMGIMRRNEGLHLVSTLLAASRLYLLPLAESERYLCGTESHVYVAPDEGNTFGDFVGSTLTWCHDSAPNLAWELLPEQAGTEYIQYWDELRIGLE